MDVSKNSGTPKSSILIGFSIINHPFWGTTIFGHTQMGSYYIWHFIRLMVSYDFQIFPAEINNRLGIAEGSPIP